MNLNRTLLGCWVASFKDGLSAHTVGLLGAFLDGLERRRIQHQLRASWLSTSSPVELMLIDVERATS